MKNNVFFKKHESVVIIIILFIIWFAFVFFVIIPANKSLKEKFISVEKKNLDNKINDNKISKLPTLESNFNLIEEKSSELEVIFSKDKIVDLAKELELIAEKTGNTINISVGEENTIIKAGSEKTKNGDAEDEFVKNLPNKNYFKINVALVGNYNSLMSFIDKLNNIQYYNTIKAFSLSSAKEVLEKDENSNVNAGIALMDAGNIAGDNTKNDIPKDRLVLESKMEILFYTLENKDENK
jgi:hypothetical protein